MKSFKVTYTLGDWYAATIQSWRHYISRVVLPFVALGVVLIMLPVIEGERLVDVLGWFPWEILFGGAALLLFYLMGACPLISFFQIKRQGALGPNYLSLADEGLRIESPKGQSVVYWPSLKRVSATKDRLFIFIGPAQAFVLPLRAFPNRTTFESTVDEAKARWVAAKG